jgi:hypothetical protein
LTAHIFLSHLFDAFGCEKKNGEADRPGRQPSDEVEIEENARDLREGRTERSNWKTKAFFIPFSLFNNRFFVIRHASKKTPTRVLKLLGQRREVSD